MSRINYLQHIAEISPSAICFFFLTAKYLDLYKNLSHLSLWLRL